MQMYLKLYNPEVFQGSLRQNRYFEGWYFKQVTSDLSCTISVIPGVSLAGKDSHSFIQILNGSTGEADYIRYRINDFGWDKKQNHLRIGSSVFSSRGLILDIHSEKFNLSGKIDFKNIIKYPTTIFSPGIMGWYSFIPFMECKHGIISVNHDLHGEITINGKAINFNNGKGYIEKDWGVSFPEAWIWVQSNNFAEHETSFSLSVAKIPWLGRYFIGFIAFLHLRNRFYLFSSYNKAVISKINHNNNLIEITLRNKNHILKIIVVKKLFGDLRAPVSGEMSRTIKESIDSEVHLQLSDRNNNPEYEGTGKSVGLEIIEKIFDYI